jgi:hypothetical protein
MEQVKVTVTIQSPTLIANTSAAGVLTSTRDTIDGRVLRGIFASQFIKTHNLGKEAHKNQEFMGLFYGDLRFVSAYKDTPKGTSIPAPLSLQKYKNADKETDFIEGDIIDSFFAKSEYTEEKKQNLLGFKGLKGYVVLDDVYCYPVQIETAIKLHMSRSSEEERKLGRSKDGNIFNYEYLEPNQVFVGTVIGPSQMLQKFVEEFKGHLDCRIGRSRLTEYGKCSVEIGNIETIISDNTAFNSDIVYIRFHTPVLLGHDSIEELLNDVFIDDITLEEVCASYQEEQNFNNIWGARSPSECAVSAGSVIQLKKESGWTTKDIETLENIFFNGIGNRVQEGYGQGRLWKPRKFITGSIDVINNRDIESIHNTSQVIARNILQERIILEARLCASENADPIKKMLEELDASKHFTTILLDVIEHSIEDKHAALKQFVKQVESEEDKMLHKNLRDIYLMHHYTDKYEKRVNLMKYIIDFEPEVLLEYCIDQFKKKNNSNTIWAKITRIVEINQFELSKLVVYEYWKYFFRHIRKAR